MNENLPDEMGEIPALCWTCQIELERHNGRLVCPKCGVTKLLVKRVLRISPKPSKESQAMRPTFLLSWFSYDKNPVRLSKAHMDVYSDASLFGSAMIPNLYEDIVETTTIMGVEIEVVHTKLLLCKYLTKAHLEVEE